ncbi:MAG: hypothetical protein KC417_13055 [Myxococcales bacterium]|nr:hypothetical protein [Myxococcales bacterium]
MRFALVATLVVTCWCALLLATHVAADTATIPVDQIHPGMKGYGFTVFRGTKPERFDVEVIDVLHDFRPDQPLIVVRTSHPILEHAKLVAGMSGSPIYIDGKLAGAYAYGWSFSRDPIAGVTPIANMRAEVKRAVRADAFPGAVPLAALGARTRAVNPRAPRYAGLEPFLGNDPFDALDATRAYAKRANFGGTGAGPVRASTPVLVSGMTDAAAALLQRELDPLGLVVLQGSGGQGKPNPGAHFVDGGGIAVQLLRGDVNMVGVGTVTEVTGSRLSAFGHPMLNAGQVGLPTATARVIHILASENRSFKIAEAETPLGTLVQDRQAAIVVDTNLKPATVPVRITLHGIDGAPRSEWRMEAASHRVLTPMVIFSGMANAINATASDVADVTFRARTMVDIDGIGPVRVTDHGFVQSGLTDTSALSRLRAFPLVEAAFANPFEASRVKSVEIDFDVTFDRNYLEVADASVDAQEVDPGETIALHVLVRAYGGREQVRTLKLRIPEQAAGEEIELRVEPGNKVQLTEPVPGSLKDIVYNIQNQLPATAIVASLKLPAHGLRFRGTVVDNLPGSALAGLQPASTTWRGVPYTTYDRQVTDVGSLVTGWAQLKLKVREEAHGR